MPPPQLYQSKRSRFCPSIDECWYGHMALCPWQPTLTSVRGRLSFLQTLLCLGAEAYAPLVLCAGTGWCKEWTGLTLSNELGWHLLIHTYMVFYVQTMYSSVQSVRNTCNLLTFIPVWYLNIRANTLTMGRNPLFKRGHIFARIARICTYICASTNIYVKSRAKLWPRLNRGFSARLECKSTYWHVSYRYIFTYLYVVLM